MNSEAKDKLQQAILSYGQNHSFLIEFHITYVGLKSKTAPHILYL